MALFHRRKPRRISADIIRPLRRVEQARPPSRDPYERALAVGLFAGILFFVDVTARQMTATAIAPVKIDIIAHGTTPDVNITDAAPTIATQRGVSATEPVYAADFASAVKVEGAHPSPAGRMFAIQPSYLQTFDVLQVSSAR